MGIETTMVSVSDCNSLKNALKKNTKVVFFEMPTNILLRVADLEGVLATISELNRPILIVDSTFASPYNLLPLEFGADLVIHSLTKYLAGHDDLLGGAVCGSKFLLDKIYDYRGVLGGICDPHGIYLILRSLKTYVIRIKQLNENGMKIAKFLNKHPKIKKIYYPGLPSHPDYLNAKKYLKGFGSVVYFELKEGDKTTQKFIELLKIPYIATNFGGVHTLIEPVSILTYAKLTFSERAEIGIGENMVRLCVGIEDINDLISDLDNALKGL